MEFSEILYLQRNQGTSIKLSEEGCTSNPDLALHYCFGSICLF